MMKNKLGWEIKTLGDYFDITSSKRVFESEWTNEGVPFYRAREVVKLATNGFVNNDLFISEKMYTDYSSKYGIPKEGDIMVTGVGTLGICYVVKKDDKFYFKDGNIIWLKNKNLINSRFVEYAFKSDYLRIQIDDGIGATVGTYTIIKAKKTKIPVPPLPTQHQIVSELNALSEIISKKKLQLEELDKLAQATFYDMFGDPVTNEKGWEVKKLNEVCDVRDGTHDSPKYVQEGYPLITSKNLSTGTISFENVNQISKVDFDNINKRSNVDDGDILMPMIGTIGNPIIVKKDRDFCIKNVALIKFKKTNKVNNIFVNMVLRNESIVEMMKSLNRGGTQKFISLGMIRTFALPIPPIEFQNQFAIKIESIENQKALINQSIGDVQQLFDYTMDKYFN